MRTLINLLHENADDYSTKGHSGMKVRRNDPRFSDNPMDTPEELDEFESNTFESRSMLDRLHDMFHDGEISDQEIEQGVQLTNGGLHKAAAALGTGPRQVKMLIATLTQHLRDANNEADDMSLQERYYRFVEGDGIDSVKDRPGNARDPDHLSAEADYLGGLTVRSAKKGDEKFYQGSQAADISKKLAAAKNDATRQQILRPLAEDFSDEIGSDSGSYNFPWKLHGRTGFGTMLYGVINGKPTMHLISVRDTAGDEVDLDTPMRHELLVQARAFIPDA